MNHRQAEEHLLGLELFGMRFGLDRMHKLMTALGMPQRRFRSVHVVGSNGKSSTVRFLTAILQRHGLRTGSYTSPHLVSFSERIEVDEEPLEERAFAAAITRAVRAAELVNRTLDPDDRVTQFELLTAAAYHELARRGVEVAVIEAGLGGRFDATNVIPSSVQVLTGVGLEHTRWLGPTLSHIAAEKLAVVPEGGCLVIGELAPEARAVVDRVVNERGARLIDTAAETCQLSTVNCQLEMRAKGPFQRHNFTLAAAAAEAFLGHLDRSAVERAAAETEIAGRLQVVDRAPLVIYDGAHNPAGARALAAALPEVLSGRPLTVVMAVLDDKDAAGMLGELLPVCERVVFTRCANPRALSPATLQTLAEQIGAPPIETTRDPRAALERARAAAGPGGAVLVTGSIYLIADLVRADDAVRASAL